MRQKDTGAGQVKREGPGDFGSRKRGQEGFKFKKVLSSLEVAVSIPLGFPAHSYCDDLSLQQLP